MTLTALSVARWKVLLAIVAVGSFATAYWYWNANTTRLSIALDNLRVCEQLAQEIRDAQQSPQIARVETWSQDDLGTAVETAATEAQVARDRILRIDPQSPRRLGKTDYMEQATEVELSDVTLQQLVDFLFAISRRDDQLENRTLRLRVPHRASEAAGREEWLADIILTQRIYSPTTARR